MPYERIDLVDVYEMPCMNPEVIVPTRENPDIKFNHRRDHLGVLKSIVMDEAA